MIEQTKTIMSSLKWSGALRTLDQRLGEAASLGMGSYRDGFGSGD